MLNDWFKSLAISLFGTLMLLGSVGCSTTQDEPGGNEPEQEESGTSGPGGYY